MPSRLDRKEARSAIVSHDPRYSARPHFRSSGRRQSKGAGHPILARRARAELWLVSPKSVNTPASQGSPKAAFARLRIGSRRAYRAPSGIEFCASFRMDREGTVYRNSSEATAARDIPHARTGRRVTGGSAPGTPSTVHHDSHDHRRADRSNPWADLGSRGHGAWPDQFHRSRASRNQEAAHGSTYRTAISCSTSRCAAVRQDGFCNRIHGQASTLDQNSFSESCNRRWITWELLSKVVYGFVMRRRDPGVLHSRI